MTKSFSIDYNEGWNAIHTERLMQGDALYLPLQSIPFIPVNYPPLSFVITSLFCSITGLPVLFAGRFFSYMSCVVIAFLIGLILYRKNKDWLGGIAGGLFWLLLMVRFAPHYVGMYDPQLMGHFFSISALTIYYFQKEKIRATSLLLIVSLVGIGFFIKHLLVVIPTVIAVDLFFRNKKLFAFYILAGCSIFLGILCLLTFLYDAQWRMHFMEGDRAIVPGRFLASLKKLFLANEAFILFLPAVALFFKKDRGSFSFLFYFVISFLLGCFVVRDSGVDINAWFNFFIASSFVFGDAIGRNYRLPFVCTNKFLVLRYVTVILCFFFLISKNNGSTHLLEKNETRFQKTVNTTSQIEGPALFEEPLLGYLAGKEFLFDPFNGTQKMLSGNATEDMLLQPIQKKYFSVISLNFPLEKALEQMNSGEKKLQPSFSERWTDNVLKKMNQNYELLGDSKNQDMYLYVPKSGATHED